MSDEIKYAYIWDGEKGKSGDTPQITVAKDGNDYYWKLNGDWLTDPDTGEKIRANGHDGISAAAPLLKLGSDITTGTINPEPKENSAYYLSIDNGANWQKVTGNKGDTGDKGDTGSTGPEGKPGSDANCIFSSINKDNADYVEFTLASGGTFQVSKYKNLSLNITTTDRDFEGDYPSISYTIEGADKASAKVSAMVDNSWKIVSVTDTEVKVKAVDGTSANLLLFLIDKNNQTYTYRLELSFKAKTITPNDDTQTLNKGEYLIKGDGTETHGQIIIKDDAVVTLHNVNINMSAENAAIKIEHGTPVILLSGTNKLTGNGSIVLANENANIIIDGKGSLTVKGTNDIAGIGSYNGDGSRCGNITILDGTLDVEGGNGAAAIGSGHWHSSCGDITISGGTITAKAINSWAEASYAIGSGHASSCRSITLSDCILHLNTYGGEVTGASYIGASTVTPNPDNAAALTAANVKLYKDGTLFNP